MRYLAATGEMADMDHVFQTEMRGGSSEIVGVMVHIMAVAGLGGTTMAAAVMSDAESRHSGASPATSTLQIVNLLNGL
jgi:hypothetical protein